MTTLNIQWDRVLKLNAIGKDNRLRKLQEEQGELAGALLAIKRDGAEPGNMRHLAEEGVDVLLMALSIIGDVTDQNPTIIVDQLFSTSSLVGERLKQSEDDRLDVATSLVLRVSELAGRLAEAEQRLSGEPSSAYKNDGGFDLITTTMLRVEDLLRLIVVSIDVMFCALPELIDLQTIFDMKMDKWERVTQPAEVQPTE